MKSFVNIDTFPFKVMFNIRPLINYWEKLSNSSIPMQAKCALNILEEVKNAPEITAEHIDLKTIDKYRDLIAYLFTGIISPYQADYGMAGMNFPYRMKPVYTTPAVENTFGDIKKDFAKIVFGQEKENFYGPTLHVYSIILKKFFNLDISFDIPIFNFKKSDPKTGLVNFFSMKNDIRFVNISYTGNKKELSDKEKKLIRENYFDLSVWMEILPPQYFVLEGFGIFTIQEDNLQQSVSSIQNKLLEKEAIINPEMFAKIEKRMKSLLSIPDIKMGVAVFTENPNSFALFRNTWLTVLKDSKLLCANYQNSVYHKAALDGSPMVVSDIKLLEEKTVIEEQLIIEGHRSIIVIPLLYDNELVGLIELASPRAGALSTSTLVKLHQVLPAFGIAAKRQAAELQNRIKAKIQEDFTAIHPAVEWKFEEIATEQLSLEFAGEKMTKKQIIFRDVYPLYGASDVKSSSTIRNEAISADLSEQLQMIESVINTVKKNKPLPILSHLSYNLGMMKNDIVKEISSGDEVKILNFIRFEVEPVLKHLGSLQEEFEGIIGVYFDMLDKEHGVLYKQRKKFEESMRILNDEVSTLIDKREDEAQKMYPHYFEKYRTDGIEFSIYIGESLVRSQPFDEIYLKNIRLWQLMVMCEITRTTSNLVEKLPLHLETTQLILIHNQPIAIRFRDDEKKFDVEGAYNLRYEITKKRIDKALIKGTNERIVQPDHIAIIYSQESEKTEYAKFLDYMIALGYIEDNIEDYKLEDMQGIYGLQAMRVKVKMDNPDAQQKSFEEITESAENFESSSMKN